MSSPAEQLEYRLGGEADVPAVLELMKASLGEATIPRTLEYFNWKHRENPFGTSPMRLAVAGETVVGVRLFMRWRWLHGSRSIAAVRAVDTATHPDWQGKGIFKKLTLALVEDLSREGVGFVFNTPNDKSRPGYLKMGWVAVGRVSLWVSPMRPARLISRLLKAAAADEEPAPTHGSIDDLLEQVHGSGLLDKLSSQHRRYATPVNVGYLRWRYARCPAVRYAALSSDPGRALVIYRLRTRSGARELTICDLFMEPSRDGLAHAVRTLREAKRRTRADYAIAAVRGSAPLQALAFVGAGFVAAPRLGPILTVRELGGWGDAPDPRLRSSHAASIGDLELF